MKKQAFLFLFLFISFLPLRGQELNLSGDGWRVMLDTEAQWVNDKLYLPSELPESLSELPVNPPSDGWASLDSSGVDAKLPLTMEEYFSI